MSKNGTASTLRGTSSDVRVSIYAAIVVAAFAIAGVADAVLAAGNIDACRPEYVAPYAEQCDFGYHTIVKDQSVKSVASAYDACARAQAVAVVCVKSPNKQVRAVAVGALYRDVGEQAEIALFAQHFPLAEALLREKSDVLRVIAQSRPAPDAAIDRERSSIAIDLRDAKAGECTNSALSAARSQGQLGKDHKYADLATLLFTKSQAYDACAPLTTSPAKRAYVRYESLVALEESGRASQAAGDTSAAKERYADCLSKSDDAAKTASPAVRRYLTTVHYLCKGRMLGKYPVDKPAPLDSDAAKSFEPLGMPN